MKYLSLKEVCEELSISVATGRNWVKLGKLLPEKIENKLYFDKNYIKQLKAEIISGKNSALKTRRNKKFKTGSAIYNTYISNTSKNLDTIKRIINEIKTPTKQLTEALICEGAIQQILQLINKPSANESELLAYLEGRTDLSIYTSLIDDIISDKNKTIKLIKNNPQFFKEKYILEQNEDILGLIYISCQNLTNRKTKGAYYTPTNIVKKLISNLKTNKNKSILDPCCGTGNFLLQLPNNIPLENIYGNDLDDMSIKITRLNMVLKFKPNNINILYKNFTNKDFLKNYTPENFDYIIGNPPWSFEFSKQDKAFLKTKFKTAQRKSIESYDVVLEQALRKLKQNGTLAFVIPEAILNVKSHKTIRELLLNTVHINSLSYLGNVFDKVDCPSIILNLNKTNKELETSGLKIETTKTKYTINQNRTITSDYFNFLTTDEEELILNKLYNTKHTTLKNNSTFALGIVTGDNKNFIKNIKTPTNEIILKGSDIEKYKINEANNYIDFSPENFQQVAPSEYYRAKEKFFYKFISDKLVFAYDDKQRLSLNSCNIIIPNIKNLSIKYVLAFLNSNLAQFIYKKKFNSVKVLRSHLEALPIPLTNKSTQSRIIKLVEELETSYNENLYNQIDCLFSSIFNLNNKEYQIILKSL